MTRLFRAVGWALVSATTLALPLQASEAAVAAASTPTTPQTGRCGNPWVSLLAGRALETDLAAVAGTERGLGSVLPLTLASGDLDEDGFLDLLTGYSTDGTGLVTWRQGNPETDDAPGDALLDRDNTLFALPEPPDFLGTGDFDADGHLDVIAGRRDGDRLSCYADRAQANSNLRRRSPFPVC